MSWEKDILNQFIPDLAPKVWLICDSDGIIRNEVLLGQLETKGFQILVFEDPIDFRYQYESLVRPAWEKENGKPLILIYEPDLYDEIPSDLGQMSHEISFGVSELFPRLDSQIMRVIPTHLWEKVRERAERLGHLNFSLTADLALRALYKLDPHEVEEEQTFLVKCLQLQKAGEPVPLLLAKDFSQNSSKYLKATGWDLVRLISDSTYLRVFLQERWQYYLENQVEAAHVDLKCEGRSQLAFDHSSLKDLIPGLIYSKYLSPVTLERFDEEEHGKPWWQIGLINRSAAETNIQKIRETLETLLTEIPHDESYHKDWIQFSSKYSDLVSSIFTLGDKSLIQRFWGELWQEVNGKFTMWFHRAFNTLHNLPPRPPVMVHHIPKQLENWYDSSKQNTALLVLDGLSFAGWKCLKPSIEKQISKEMSESSTFSWVPSSTNVSRQAIFSGKAPCFFQDSINTTSKDARHWQAFWESNQGLLKKEIIHHRCDGDIQDMEEIQALLETSPKAIGMTLSKPDVIMHNAIYGWESYFHDLEKWMQEGALIPLIKLLIKKGYGISITADHGNLESIGGGKINDGVLAESRGQRARVYNDPNLRAVAATEFIETQTWDSSLLPENFLPIFPTSNIAFDSKGETIVSHGGISLDEILVPWVNINREY